MKHKHCELIKQWADGAVIQARSHDTMRWRDTEDNSPLWLNDTKYRVKPEKKVILYRVYRAMRSGVQLPDIVIGYSDTTRKLAEYCDDFGGWLTDELEMEVTDE
jgi:hypothetical protein